MAGAAAGAQGRAVRRDERHPGGHLALRGGVARAHRPPRGAGRRRRAARAPGVRVRGGPPAGHCRAPARRGPLARVHRALLPARRGGHRQVLRPQLPGPQGPQGPDRGRPGGRPLRAGLRPDPALPAGPGRRRPPRGDAAALPAPRRTPHPAGPAAHRVRHRHPGGRHQRADPHGPDDLPHQVRRRADAPPERPRVPPDRGPGGARGLRHGRFRAGPGPRARGGGRPREGAPQRGAGGRP